MTHLLTVLGTGKYTETCYVWREKQVETQFAAEALSEFFDVDRVTALLTKEAEEMHWQTFQTQLSDRLGENSAKFRRIPFGQSETEIWQIFDAVVDAVQPGEQVIFDVTNAFRSIPILVLLAAAFLQKARNVKIQGVYYGAFIPNTHPTPIVDLTPAVKLLDWLTATNQFIGSGSSIELTKLLSTLQQDFERSSQAATLQVKPKRLRLIGKRIEKISRSIDFIRPRDLLTEAAALQAFDRDSLKEEIGTFAKPFELLLEQIQQDYGQFGLKVDQASPQQVLQKQFLLLRWYVAKDLGTQAILLAREWIVSVLCVEEKLDYLRWRDREQVEQALNDLRRSQLNLLELSIARHTSAPRQLLPLWSKLTTYRNDVAHTKTGSAISAEELQAYVQQGLLQELIELFPKQTV